MYILGLDIGGTKCAAVTGRWDGKEITLQKKAVCETNLKIGAERMLERLFELAEGLLDGTPDAVGISCGGPLDSGRGVIMSPPNLPGWDNVEIVRLAKDRFGAEAYLQNDANACAVAEWKFGAGRGYRNLVFLTFGTGLGAGLILNGELYEGTNGNAGEVGHVRLDESGPVGFGKHGSFEGFCSGGGIARLGCQMAREAKAKGITPAFYRDGDESVSAKAIAEAAREGDKTAIEVYRTSGKYLGRGLSVIIDILNPECIIIGGVYKRSGDLLIESALSELDHEALGESAGCCKILPAELGEEIGDYSALAVAINGKGASHRCALVDDYPALAICEADILAAKDTLVKCYENDGKLLLAGNGGSAADCDHIVGELMKGFMLKRPLKAEQRQKMRKECQRLDEDTLDKLQGSLPAISLPSLGALNTAFSNDVDPYLVYAQSVLGLGKKDDVLFAISTSGNSKNVVEAAKVAKALGLKVIALTGSSGGELSGLANVCIHAPESETYKVQQLHLPIYHYLCSEIEKHFFG